MAEMGDYLDYVVEKVMRGNRRTVLFLRREHGGPMRYDIPIEIGSIIPGNKVTFRTADFDSKEPSINPLTRVHQSYIWADISDAVGSIITLTGADMAYLEEKRFDEVGTELFRDAQH